MFVGSRSEYTLIAILLVGLADYSQPIDWILRYLNILENDDKIRFSK